MAAAFAPFPLGNPAMELVLALVAGNADQPPIVSGTAVFIAPGLAMTAAHVFHDYWERYGHGADMTMESDAPFAVQAYQYLPAEERYVLWRMVTLVHADAIDIALLQLAPMEGLPQGYLQAMPLLDVRPPTESERLFVIGIPGQTPVWKNGGWTVTADPYASAGEVTQVFQSRRDSVRLRFPSFEVEVEAVGGMSGGPLFDQAGALRGVLCSSFEFADPSMPVAYASTLWPALGLGVPPTDALGTDALHTLLELGHRGVVRMMGHEGLSVAT